MLLSMHCLPTNAHVKTRWNNETGATYGFDSVPKKLLEKKRLKTNKNLDLISNPKTLYFLKTVVPLLLHVGDQYILKIQD